MNARVALRLAHTWSQRQAADEWNRRWPDEPKTFKNFSYWEQWPSSTGYEPSLAVLGRLAQLYDCSVSDLVADLPDYHDQDSAHPLTVTNDLVVLHQVESLFGGLARHDDSTTRSTLSPVVVSRDALPLLQRLQESSFVELAQVIVMWTHRLSSAVNRRELLSKVSAAFSLAAAAPLFDVLDSEERKRSTPALHDPSSFDEPTLHYGCSSAGVRRSGL
ncbi:MAG: hypothetical protein ACRDQ5_24125 [Sciscionella sp.]